VYMCCFTQHLSKRQRATEEELSKAKWIKTVPKTPVSILKELILQYELGPALAASARACSMKTAEDDDRYIQFTCIFDKPHMIFPACELEFVKVPGSLTLSVVDRRLLTFGRMPRALTSNAQTPHRRLAGTKCRHPASRRVHCVSS
jgi:hypothetical protein